MNKHIFETQAHIAALRDVLLIKLTQPNMTVPDILPFQATADLHCNTAEDSLTEEIRWLRSLINPCKK